MTSFQQDNLRKKAAQDKQRAKSYYTLGFALMQLCQKSGFKSRNAAKSASNYFSLSIRYYASDPRPYTAMGYLLMVYGDLKQAHSYFHEALRLMPSHLPAKRLLKRLQVLDLKRISKAQLKKKKAIKRLELDSAEPMEPVDKRLPKVPQEALSDQENTKSTRQTAPVKKGPPTRIQSILGPPGPHLSQGAEIKLLQRALRRLGFAQVKVSGRYDKLTFQAIKRIQMKKGLKQDGLVKEKLQLFFNHQLDKLEAEQIARQDIFNSFRDYFEAFAPKALPPEEELKSLVGKLVKSFLTGPTEGEVYTAAPRAHPQFQTRLGSKGEKGVVSAGPEVSLLQATLKELGHEVPQTKTFDLQTFTAVKSLQQSLGLPESGIIEGAIRQHLNHHLTCKYARLDLDADILDSLLAVGSVLKKPIPLSLAESLRNRVEEIVTLYAPRELSEPKGTLALTSDLGPPQQKNMLSEGEEVHLLQRLLVQEGFELEVGNPFDKATYRAVRNLQSRLKQPITGCVDKALREYLNAQIPRLLNPESEDLDDLLHEEEAPEPEDTGPKTRIDSELGTGNPLLVSEGEEVILLQKALAHLGFKVKETGSYDTPTTMAVRKLQTSEKLPLNGKVDKATAEAVNQVLDRMALEAHLLQTTVDSFAAYAEQYQLPWEDLQRQVLKTLMERLLSDIRQHQAEEGADIFDRSTLIKPERPLLQGDLGTKGQLGIVSEGLEVQRLQEVLVSLGFDLKVNGSFDLQTFTALKAYQSQQGIEPSGVAYEDTREAINSHLEKRYLEELVQETLKDSLITYAESQAPEFDKSLYLQIETVLSQLLAFVKGELEPALILKNLDHDLGPPGRGLVSHGVGVLMLQLFLKENAPQIEVSGEYDNATQKAIRQIQQQNKLPLTGVFDAKVRALLLKTDAE